MLKCPWARHQNAPDVLVPTLRGSHRHHCMNELSKSLWTEASAKCRKCKENSAIERRAEITLQTLFYVVDILM